MDVLSVIFSILPLFLIMLLGVFVRKVGIFDWQTTKRLSAFIVNITQPFLPLGAWEAALGMGRVFLAEGVASSCFSC